MDFLRSQSFLGKFSIISLTILLFTSCREPIELNFPTSDAKLVVDGFVTNVDKEHLIKLTYSSGFTDGGVNAPDFITNANVEIIDDLGNSVLLNHRTNGQYYTPVMKAEPDRSYKIVIDLEQERYESSFQKTPEYQEAAKVRYEPSSRQVLSSNETSVVEQKGVSILVDFDEVNESTYYQWHQKDYYIHDAARGQMFFMGVFFPNKFCFVRDFDRIQLDVFENVPKNTDEAIQLEIGFIPTSVKLYQDFSVLVTQLITNRESHEYWTSIGKQKDNVGSQFDSAPTSIYGNVESGSGRQALGFFGVYNESEERIFFNNCELPLSHRKPLFDCADPLTVSDAQVDPCFNCLNAAGLWNQLEAPEWWRPEVAEFLGEDSRSCFNGGGG